LLPKEASMPNQSRRWPQRLESAVQEECLKQEYQHTRQKLSTLPMSVRMRSGQCSVPGGVYERTAAGLAGQRAAVISRNHWAAGSAGAPRLAGPISRLADGAPPAQNAAVQAGLAGGAGEARPGGAERPLQGHGLY